MAFRDRIEAVLQAKDVQRFKQGMKQAARAVKSLGDEGVKTSAELEILEAIEEKLEHQTYELVAALEVLQSSVDEVGDEMIQTAAKTELANRAMKKSGSNAVFLGKSWAFWKDRLSLTRSEIMTTSLTIGSYLSPAIVALGSNFVNAAIGGGAVGAAGLSTFLFGLGSLGIIGKEASKNLDKIRTAQQQLLITQQQYGASSLQASRANAHLYATIQQFGGNQAAGLLASGQALRNRYTTLTAPARSNVYGIASKGVSAAQRLLPTYARNVNKMSGAAAQAAGPLLKVLSGEQAKGLLNTLGDTFSKSIGPVANTVANMFQVIGRIISVNAPEVVLWAKSWERTTDAWEKGTRSRSKLKKFFDAAVIDFKLWLGLAKELFRTLRIIFSATKDQGNNMLRWLTNVVKKFNDWLQMAKDTGAIDAFYNKWIHSLDQIFWAIQHPFDAIEKYLPRLMDTIADTFAREGPHAAELFLTGFINAGSWTKFLTITYLLYKFKVFSSLGKMAGTMFVAPFVRQFMISFTAALFGASAEEGAIGAAMKNFGGKSGAIFGRAFALGLIAAIASLAPEIANAVLHALDPSNAGKITWKTGLQQLNPLDNVVPFLKRNLDALFGNPLKPFGGRATGGQIGLGQSSWVGEAGPEIATATPYGTQVTPLGSGATPGDTPDLRGALHIILHSHVYMNRREVATAYNEEKAFNDARRGVVASG